MKKLLKRHSRKDKAQGMVEFALVLPVLLLVIFGVIELGRLFVIYSSVMTASREAARYASASGKPPGKTMPYYADCEGINAAARRVTILTSVSSVDILYDYGPNAAQPQNRADMKEPDIRGIYCESINPVWIHLGDRVNITVSSFFTPTLGIINIPGFPIQSQTYRTIIKDMSISGTPPVLPPTYTPKPTLTLTVTPTKHNDPTMTPTNTATQTLTRTPTPTRTVTYTPTNSPTITPTFTEGPSPTPTNTRTTTPTRTNTPTRTSTLTPTPSPTFTPIPCIINPGNYIWDKNTISWEFTNNSYVSYTLVRLTIPWIQAETNFIRVAFGGQELWSGTDPNVGSLITGSTFGPIAPAEYLWNVASAGFIFEPGPGHIEALSMTWDKNLAYDSIPNLVVVVFSNNETNTLCSYSQAFP